MQDNSTCIRNPHKVSVADYRYRNPGSGDFLDVSDLRFSSESSFPGPAGICVNDLISDLEF